MVRRAVARQAIIRPRTRTENFLKLIRKRTSRATGFLKLIEKAPRVNECQLL